VLRKTHFEILLYIGFLLRNELFESDSRKGFPGGYV